MREGKERVEEGAHQRAVSTLGERMYFTCLPAAEKMKKQEQNQELL